MIKFIKEEEKHWFSKNTTISYGIEINGEEISSFIAKDSTGSFCLKTDRWDNISEKHLVQIAGKIVKLNLHSQG